MGKIVNLRREARRLFPAFFATVFVLALAAQMLPEIVSAVGSQVTARSITMSSSAPSATATTWTLSFTPTATTPTTHPDVILDFCNAASDPIVGDTCSGTAGTDVPNFTTPPTATGWTITSIDSNHGLKMTTTTLNFANGTPFSIPLAGITNPSATAGFYARFLDYATGGAGSNTSASPGSYVDYGGFALSTASNISITSKVFETLSFCVYTGSCGTAPALILGDPTSGALSSANAYMNDNTLYNLATNAGGGVVVTMKGTTLCRPGGSCATGASAFTIGAIGVTPAVSIPGSEQFGMCAYKNGSSALTVATQYIDSINACNPATLGSSGSYSGSSKFGFDDTATTTTGTASAGGSQVLTSSGAVPAVTGNFAFMANVAPTTEAGIYTTSLNLVATGTF